MSSLHHPLSSPNLKVISVKGKRVTGDVNIYSFWFFLSSCVTKETEMADCMSKELENRKKISKAVEIDGDGSELSPNTDVTDGEVVLQSTTVKNRKRKRKRKRDGTRHEEEDEFAVFGARDPLIVFGSDIMMKILSYLDARSVALSLLVSRGWHGVASSDALWSPKCEELWLGKAHIRRISQAEGLSKLAAYSLSVMDGKRTRIMKEDLWDHVWEFRFNELAPEYWRNLDPYWKGTRPLMHRYFHPDGSQTADPDDKVWGGHESCYSIVTSFLANGKIREHYVRINRWPRLLISRKEDWSWEMSNNICCYSSVPDAVKEDGTGPDFSAL